MTENVQVEINGEYSLRGTLTIPNGRVEKYPAVLIIPGTGQLDRDGNDKKVQLNIYKEIATFLTSLGFITLRYDKRGTHDSGGNYYEAGVDDLIADAVDCIRFLKQHENVDQERICIVGHSEGALLAPAVYTKEKVAGLILLAGGAEPTKELLPRQLEMVINEVENMPGIKGWLLRLLNVPKKLIKQNQATMNKVMGTNERVIRIKGIKVNAKWLRDQMEYDVCNFLPAVTCPVLAITGDKDIQVPPEQAEQIGALVKGKSSSYVIPNMNHILKHYSGQHSIMNLKKEYKKLANDPLDPTLLQIIKDWTNENLLSEIV